MASNQYPSGTHYDVPGSHPEYTRDQSGTSEGYMDPHASSDPANVQPHLSNDSHSYPPSGMAYNPDPSYDDLLNEKELANVTNARMSAYSRSTGEAIPRPRNAAGGIGPGGLRSSMAGANGARPTSQWTVGFEPPPKSTGILRMWRKENRASWARGGGLRTSCRFFSCCFLTFIFLLVSIVLTILLYVRPPNIQLKGIQVPTSNAVSVSSNELIIKFNLDIAVTNPNWFAADFSSITAVARYPGANTNEFGGGSLDDIKFPGNSGTTFQFPFSLNYTTALDPSGAILKDLITKCTATPVRDITINYDLTLALKILSLKIKPTISSSATFQCPVSSADLASLAQGLAGTGFTAD